MENNENKPTLTEIEPMTGWSEKELLLLREAEIIGSRPISPTLAAQMFALFLESYSCAEIAKQNKGLSESDILVCRHKFKWDEEKDRYAFDLNRQIREKLVKAKLEALEYLTNKLSVVHKVDKEQTLRYLQTGKKEDLPADWQMTPTAYKSIFETIQKVTGEERISKQEITSKVTVEDNRSPDVDPTLQSKMLRLFASEEKKKDEQ